MQIYVYLVSLMKIEAWFVTLVQLLLIEEQLSDRSHSRRVHDLSGTCQVFVSYWATMAILLGLGAAVVSQTKDFHIYAKEEVWLWPLCLILWSFFGMRFPLSFSGQIPSIIDVLLWSQLWPQQQGATILDDQWVSSPILSSLAQFLTDWEDGVMIFALAIMDNNKNSHLEVMKGRSSWSILGRSFPELKTRSNPLLLVLRLVLPLCGSLFPADILTYDSFVIMQDGWNQGLYRFNDGIATTIVV